MIRTRDPQIDSLQSTEIKVQKNHLLINFSMFISKVSMSDIMGMSFKKIIKYFM